LRQSKNPAEKIFSAGFLLARILSGHKSCKASGGVLTADGDYKKTFAEFLT
jgi:hypothetical protein